MFRFVDLYIDRVLNLKKARITASFFMCVVDGRGIEADAVWTSCPSSAIGEIGR